MPRAGLLFKLPAQNILFSLVAIAICMGLFHVLSLIFNSCAHSEGLAFVWRVRHDTSPNTLKQYYHARNLFLAIGAAVGMASSQVV